MISNLDKNKVLELEKKINYNFKNFLFLEEALSHPSLKQIDTSEDHKDYDRFELLGDSILGFIITELLLNKFKNSAEGSIAKFKSFLICKGTLYKIANKINLADYIIMTVGEEKSGGRTNPNNLENAIEALLAAIYLDSNIESVRSVIYALWADEIQNVNLKELDPKTHLQEWSQAHGYGMPIYEVIDREGPVHSPNFTVKAYVGSYTQHGEGGTIKLAEKNAAKKLLNSLENK